MPVQFKHNSRTARNFIAQRQLELLQKYGQSGVAGLSALDQFREMMLQISTEVEEAFDEGFFKYRCGQEFICMVNWHRDGLQILFNGSGPAKVFEIDSSTNADWDAIRSQLLQRIRG